MCRTKWRFLQSIGVVAARFWEWVAIPWRHCSAQRCLWWCLCCNKWVCWIALIILAVLLIVFLILYVVWSLVMVIFCEFLCIIVTFLQAPSGSIRVRCFQTTDSAPPSSGSGSGSSSGGLNPPEGPGGPGTGTTTGSGNMISYSLPAAAAKITTAKQLLREATTWRFLLRTSSIHLELSDAPMQACERLRAAIDERMKECGCLEGKIGMAAALALFVGLSLAYPAAAMSGGWTTFALQCLGVAVVGAFSGKVAGVLRARIALRREIRNVLTSLGLV